MALSAAMLTETPGGKASNVSTKLIESECDDDVLPTRKEMNDPTEWSEG